jgi:hypothetical protein
MSFGVNDDPAARSRTNRFFSGQAVVESKQAVGGLAFERAVKLQKAAEGSNGFFGLGEDVNLLTHLQVVETERNAVVVRERAA